MRPNAFFVLALVSLLMSTVVSVVLSAAVDESEGAFNLPLEEIIRGKYQVGARGI